MSNEYLELPLLHGMTIEWRIALKVHTKEPGKKHRHGDGIVEGSFLIRNFERPLRFFIRKLILNQSILEAGC